MSETAGTISGGCLCGALRWEAVAAPSYQGLCYCADCRKASGSGFIGFMSFPRAAVRFSGASVAFRSPSARGGVATRNSCPTCHSLVFGGEVATSDSFTIYAGSLDDAARFVPTLAIFGRDRPAWVAAPPGLTVFETLPGLAPPE